MPSTYTGLRTGTETNDTAPAPEKVPVLNHPLGGEAATVSSVLSALKNLANHVSYLLFPQAKAGDHAKHIMGWRSAPGHKRFVVDHAGFPMGRIVTWREGWYQGEIVSGQQTDPLNITGAAMRWSGTIKSQIDDAGDALEAAGVETTFNATVQAQLVIAGAALKTAAGAMFSVSPGSEWWARTALAAAGSSFVTFATPTADLPNSRHVLFDSGQSTNDFALLFRKSECLYHDDVELALEWEAQLAATGMGGCLTACMGLAPENGIPSSVGGTAADYVVFEKAPSGNWFIRRRSGGATAVGVDTTVAATTSWTKFRIEFSGGNVADGGARVLRCYINGVKVGGDITTDIPVSTAEAAVHFSLHTTGSGASGLTNPLRVGPVRSAHNIYPADVA